MLIKISNVAAVNPFNVSAINVEKSGMISVKLNNGRTHTIMSSDVPRDFDALFAKLAKHIDLFRIDRNRAVNVDCVVSVGITPKGAAINMIGDFSVYIAIDTKYSRLPEIMAAFEGFNNG